MIIDNFKKNKQTAKIRKLVCESLFEGAEGFENKCFKSKEELDDLISSYVVYPEGFDWIFVSDLEQKDETEKAFVGLEHRQDLTFISLAYEIDLMVPNGIKFGLLYELDDELKFDQYENLGELVKRYNEDEELRNLIGELPSFEQRQALEQAVNVISNKVNEELTSLEEE